MNTIKLIALHTAGSLYETLSGQSFTQRKLIPKVVKFYKEKSLVMNGINRYLQWRDSAFL